MHIHSSSSFFFALLFSLNFALNFVLNFEALSLFSSIDASGEVFFQSLSLSPFFFFPFFFFFFFFFSTVSLSSIKQRA